MFFHKNKRKFAFCSKRTAFCALFLFAIFSANIVTSLILNVNAQLVPVKSVNITSQYSNYENNEPGSWKITKSAEWIKTNEARITFEINSVPKYDNDKKLDVIMVIDNSGSMEGDKIAQVKADAADLADTLLSDSENQIALITFGTEATLLSELSNDKTAILNHINLITTGECTNYYRGLLEAEKILEGYIQQENRELILLFLTDGYPNEETPNEVAEYHILKEAHPYMVINGIQYEMGDELLQPIIDISDYQYIADMTSLNNVLFEATTIPYTYDNFIITDYINDDYWSVAASWKINAEHGSTSLTYDGSTPIVTWNLNGIYRSGQTITMTIDIHIRDDIDSIESLLLPTNHHETIKTSVAGNQDENIDSALTPVLKDAYSVIYEANIPNDCDVSGVIPDTIEHLSLSTVKISDNQLFCTGYVFRGWKIQTKKVKIINDDYFRMPSEDVHIAGIWSKPSISKSLDGTLHTRTTATFDSGSSLNVKMKRLSGQSGASNSSWNYYINAFKRSYTLPASVDTSNSSNIFSSASSQEPIYGWYESSTSTIYYYSNAEDIYFGSSASNMFAAIIELSNIDGLRDINTSNLVYTSSMFEYDYGITDLSALANWDTSKLEYMSSMFSNAKGLTNLDGLSNWDTSKVKSMYNTFTWATSLTNIEGVRNWDLSSVTSIGNMFSCDSLLTDISPLANWDTTNIQNMSNLFMQSESLSNISPLTNWNTSNVTDMSYMFGNLPLLSNISALANWDTSNVTNMEYLFGGSDSLSDIGPLANWDTSNITNISYLFTGGSESLTDLTPISKWNTSKVTTLQNTFTALKGLTDLSPIGSWDTSKVQSMYATFRGLENLTDLSPINNWDVSNVKCMAETFRLMTSLTNLNGINKWNTASLTDMRNTFRDDTALTNIDGLLNWDMSKVTQFSYTFQNATSLQNIDGALNWRPTSATTMEFMFSGDTSLASINGVINWSTPNVTKMTSMFRNTSITNLNGVQNWSIPSATDLSYMFADNGQLTNIDGLLSWDVSGVTTMSYMFTGVNQLTNLDALRNWRPSNVTSLYGTFSKMTSLTDISGLSNWTTTSLTNITNTFYNDAAITDLSPLENWDSSKITNKSNTFSGIPSTITRPSWY